MGFTQDQLLAIDERVKAGKSAITATGVIVTRNSLTDAYVVFDGSQAPYPVKVGASVTCFEGDRVILLKSGIWWTIVTSLYYRGNRKYNVANKAARPTQNLTFGDQVHQQDSSVEYWWNGSVWIPTGGQSVFSWVRGPGLAANNKLLTTVTGNQVAYTTASIEVEPSTLYTLSTSLFMSSGAGSAHFFKSYVYVSGISVADAGEKLYTAGNGGQRLNIQTYPYLTGSSQTSVVFELRSDDGAAAAYDVTADPSHQAYLHVVAAGRTSAGTAT